MKLNYPLEIPHCLPAPTESPGDGPPPAGPCVLCKAQGDHQVSAPCQGLQPFPPARAEPAAPLAAAGTGDSPSSLVSHHWEMQVTLETEVGHACNTMKFGHGTLFFGRW